MPWVVYVLLCDNSSYYVGISNNLDKRLRSHKSGYNIATKEFSNIKLVYTEKYDRRINAEKLEKQLKGWTEAKKKSLVDGDINRLRRLSKNSEIAKDARGKK